MADQDGYKTRAAYITERKKTEFESRKRVEDRGGTITTSSSALVTFVFGITVFLTGKEKDATKFVSEGAATTLLVALGAFVFAALIGIFVQNAPLKYMAADMPTLKSFVEKNKYWNGTEPDAASDCVWLDLDSIESLQKGTRVKAIAATAALVVQGIAIVLLIVALGLDFDARGII